MSRLIKTIKPGLDDNETMKGSLIHIKVIVIKMFDYIMNVLVKERIYSSRKRTKHFAVSGMEC